MTLDEDRLSAREREALELLAEDLIYEDVAVRMHISHSTARTHIKTAFNKLGVRSGIGASLKLKEMEREKGIDQLLTDITVADRLEADPAMCWELKVDALLKFVGDERVSREFGR